MTGEMPQQSSNVTLNDVIPKRSKPWWRDWNVVKLNTLLLCALLTQTAQGFDASMINGMQALPQWIRFFGHPKGARLGAMTFGPTGGILISIVVSSQLCDRFGRRYPICGGSIIIIIASAVQAASVNLGMFVFSRFLVGFGLGIVSVAAPPLLSEVAYPTHRGKLVSFYLVSWPLGSLIAAWVTYGSFSMDSSWSWRLPSLLQCTFSIVQAILSLFAPESPRWLIYRGRDNEALDIFVKYHGDGDADSQLAHYEMAEITAVLAMEKMQMKSRWREWISSKGNIHRLFLALFIPAMLQWSGNGLISYYLAEVLRSIGITDSKTQLIINGCLSICSLLSACFFATLVDRVGRRGLFLFGMSGMGVSYIIWTVCSAINEKRNFEDQGFARSVLAMIFLYMVLYHACSPVAPTYIMEIVPYSLRSKASMLYQLTGNLAMLYNSFANPVAMDAISWRYYIIWCVVIGVNLTLIFFFFPETKNRGLEEVAEIFDGPNALPDTKQLHLDQNEAEPGKDGNSLGKTKAEALEQVEQV